MKKYIAIYTTDNGATTARAEVTAATYTAAFLRVLVDLMPADAAIIELKEI